MALYFPHPAQSTACLRHRADGDAMEFPRRPGRLAASGNANGEGQRQAYFLVCQTATREAVALALNPELLRHPRQGWLKMAEEAWAPAEEDFFRSSEKDCSNKNAVRTRQ